MKTTKMTDEVEWKTRSSNFSAPAMVDEDLNLKSSREDNVNETINIINSNSVWNFRTVNVIENLESEFEKWLSQIEIDLYIVGIQNSQN